MSRVERVAHGQEDILLEDASRTVESERLAPCFEVRRMESTSVPSQSKTTASKPPGGKEKGPMLAIAAEGLETSPGIGKRGLSWLIEFSL